MKPDLNSFLPLAPATLHILLALAGEDLHGYGIMQEVARQSDGRYRLGPGTLYDNLQKLLDAALVEEAPAPKGETDSRRRCAGRTAAARRQSETRTLRSPPRSDCGGRAATPQAAAEQSRQGRTAP